MGGGMGIALLVLAQLPLEDAAAARKSWRHETRCGQNSLVGYVQLHGGRMAHRELLDELIPPTDAGASLLELRDAANYFDVPSRVFRVPADEIGQFTLPIIAHLHGQKGHYVLITHVARDAVDYADLTTLEIGRWTMAEFGARFSGYVLAPHESWWPLIGPGAAGFILAFGFCYFRFRWRRGGA